MIALFLKARAFSISWEVEKREINNFLNSKRRPGRTLGKLGNKNTRNNFSEVSEIFDFSEF